MQIIGAAGEVAGEMPAWQRRDNRAGWLAPEDDPEKAPRQVDIAERLSRASAWDAQLLYQEGKPRRPADKLAGEGLGGVGDGGGRRW